MKKLFSILTILLLAVACEQNQTDEPQVEQPQFPEAVTATVASGGEYTLTFDANLDWEVSIPQSAAAYFYIKDGDNRLYTMRGQKGSHTIVIGAESVELFDIDLQCEVTMTMAEQSEVIATLTIIRSNRELQIFSVVVEDGAFGYATSGDEIYAYQTTEVTADGVTMIWPYEMALFSTRVKIVSNFDWIVDGTPEWIAPISGGKAGVTELWIKGNEAKYPLTSQSAVLNIVDAAATDKVAGSLKVTIPAATDIFTVEGFAESSEFDSEGLVYNSMIGEYVEGTINGSVTAVNGTAVVAVEFTETAGLVQPQLNPQWLTIDYAQWDAASDAVIQSRTLSLAAAKNEGAARSAVVLVLPADTATDNIDQIAVNDIITEQYQPYIVTTVNQAAAAGALEFVDQQVMEANGNAIAALDASHWIFGMFAGVAEGYDLLYTSAWTHEDWYINVTKPYTEIKCHSFDVNGNLVEISGRDAWISTTIFGAEKSSVRIQMDTTKATAATAQNLNTGDYEGVVTFADSEGIFALIFCRYNENAVVGGSDISFYYPDYAAQQGSTLVELTSGDIYTKYASYGERVMHLTFTTATPNMSMLKGIPQSWNSSYVDPADEDWLKFEGGEEYQTIIMNAAKGNGKTGALVLGEGKLVLVCTLNIAQ